MVSITVGVCRDSRGPWKWGPALGAAAGVFLAVSMGGCGEPDSQDESIAVVRSELLNHPTFTASETVVTSATVDSGGRHRLVMTYNHADPDFITYVLDSRQVAKGASMMRSFFISPEDDAGVVATLRPPTGWAVLWGDPAITRHRANANMVYMTNLAVPNAKFPSFGGIHGALTLDPPATSPMCGSYLGGACIARSSDGGRSFTLSANDCVRRTSATCPNGTFYDGSAMETSPEGRVYAAYQDTFRGRIDVYMATSQTGSFTKITDPSVGSTSGGHPRLKYGPGGLYLLTMNGSKLMLTRYGGGSSTTGTWTTPIQVADGVTRNDVVFSDRRVRLGPQYDFDVGLNETGGTDLRVVYLVLDVASKHHLRVSRCTTGPTITCAQRWSTDAVPSDQFHPAITSGTSSTGAAYWALSWHDRRSFPTGNQTELWRGTVRESNGTATFARTRQEGAQRPCPDLRGYWGDYDTMASGPGGFTFRGFSNSFNGSNCTRDEYTSAPLGASLTSWTQ